MMVTKMRRAATINFIRWWDNFNESMFTGGETGNEGTPLSSLTGPGPPGVVRGAHPTYLEGVEAEEGDASRVKVPVDTEDAAVFPWTAGGRGRVFGCRFSVVGGIHGSVGSVNAVPLPGPYNFSIKLFWLVSLIRDYAASIAVSVPTRFWSFFGRVKSPKQSSSRSQFFSQVAK